MADIFISYAKEDRSKVKKIAEALQQQGWSVFWDPVIPPGKTWREVLEEELRNARCVIVVWSKQSVKSHWVNEEAEDGNSRGILVPIRIDPVSMPLGFRSVQAADLTDWDGRTTAPGFAILLSSPKTWLKKLLNFK